MMGWLIFLGGVVLGVLARNAWGDTRYMIAKEEFEETTIVQGKEIARLRSQVADLIGKE
jgi:hypothetical protein